MQSEGAPKLDSPLRPSDSNLRSKGEGYIWYVGENRPEQTYRRFDRDSSRPPRTTESVRGKVDGRSRPAGIVRKRSHLLHKSDGVPDDVVLSQEVAPTRSERRLGKVHPPPDGATEYPREMLDGSSSSLEDRRPSIRVATPPEIDTQPVESRGDNPGPGNGGVSVISSDDPGVLKDEIRRLQVAFLNEFKGASRFVGGAQFKAPARQQAGSCGDCAQLREALRRSRAEVRHLRAGLLRADAEKKQLNLFDWRRRSSARMRQAQGIRRKVWHSGGDKHTSAFEIYADGSSLKGAESPRNEPETTTSGLGGKCTDVSSSGEPGGGEKPAGPERKLSRNNEVERLLSRLWRGFERKPAPFASARTRSPGASVTSPGSLVDRWWTAWLSCTIVSVSAFVLGGRLGEKGSTACRLFVEEIRPMLSKH